MGVESGRRPFAGRGEAGLLTSFELIALTYRFSLADMRGLTIYELSFWFQSAVMRQAGR